MARISTHILDLATGKPAAGVLIELRHGDQLIATATTNQDGRTDQPLLSVEFLPPGPYELTFHTRSYLAARASFFDDIVICFHVEEADGNYHVPLLLSPYGYSTYRGS